jgi:hypothetical protein
MLAENDAQSTLKPKYGRARHHEREKYGTFAIEYRGFYRNPPKRR